MTTEEQNDYLLERLRTRYEITAPHLLNHVPTGYFIEAPASRLEVGDDFLLSSRSGLGRACLYRVYRVEPTYLLVDWIGAGPPDSVMDDSGLYTIPHEPFTKVLLQVSTWEAALYGAIRRSQGASPTDFCPGNSSVQELAKLAMEEIERLTRELHQRHCHPDYEYIQFTVEGINQKDAGNKEEELIREGWERQQWYHNSFVMRRRRKGKGEDVQVKILRLYPPREEIVGG